MSFIPAVVTFFVTLVIVAPITWVVSSKAINKSNDEKIGNANERAREIIDEALKAAETKKKEALLEVKEESLKTKNELDKETKKKIGAHCQGVIEEMLVKNEKLLPSDDSRRLMQSLLRLPKPPPCLAPQRGLREARLRAGASR